ncbi:hypothetical protein B0T26DRAFT_755197 [Lasiosphaeria miniovina]|uniref:Uncharacterized protein n=1 Tax=Lasiosphaeria miniovina TaxID=1954250 RepID=A0AA40A679_9PEZI|nr:uncharacterized protein B0T26DRAFT_755197 [Lasiosphaeria miniovina]KAK0710078.1 hypothetical protein B0T26DRAFT_755197 [Lasiosphaeria miniovina]
MQPFLSGERTLFILLSVLTVCFLLAAGFDVPPPSVEAQLLRAAIAIADDGPCLELRSASNKQWVAKTELTTLPTTATTSSKSHPHVRALQRIKTATATAKATTTAHAAAAAARLAGAASLATTALQMLLLLLRPAARERWHSQYLSHYHSHLLGRGRRGLAAVARAKKQEERQQRRPRARSFVVVAAASFCGDLES